MGMSQLWEKGERKEEEEKEKKVIQMVTEEEEEEEERDSVHHPVADFHVVVAPVSIRVTHHQRPQIVTMRGGGGGGYIHLWSIGSLTKKSDHGITNLL